MKIKRLAAIGLLYLIISALTLSVAYKFFGKAINYRINDIVREIKYFKAIHTKHTLEKEEWLKKWHQMGNAWQELSYMLHVPYLMFQYTPNIRTPFLNTNDMGFRGKENYSHYPSVKPDPGYRYIVLLGGSSGFGAFSTSDETCISGYLEKMLNENIPSSKQFKVINLSMGFYNSFQELIAFILYGLKFEPEAVITFDGFNDASVSASSHGGKKIPLITGNYYYTREVLSNINRLSLKTKHKEYFPSQVDSLTAWDKESADFVNDVAELYRKNLELVCVLSKEYNFKVILTLQPIQVLPDGHLAWLDHRQELEKIYQLLPVKIKNVAGDYAVSYIDFQEIFAKNKEYNDYFSHTDAVHLIDKGQEIVARHMLEKLEPVLAHE